MVFRLLLLFILANITQVSVAQTIENTFSYKSAGSDKYIRLTYENDFFSAADRYYTQGIQLEIAHPSLQKNPINTLLLSPSNFSTVTYGIALEHDAYTPTSITANTILQNDRPYAACIMVRSYTIATDPAKRQAISSSLNLGVIGKAASGEWMQRGIHRWVNSVQPEGWQYQVKNDLILNYRLNYERNLLTAGNFFAFNATASASAGTLLDKVSLGINMMTGYFTDPYRQAVPKKLRVYLYVHPQLSAVGYDATLQGGIFTNNDPYTIAPKDMQRIVFSGRGGVVIHIGAVYLEYFQAISTREFSSQQTFYWGGVLGGITF